MTALHCTYCCFKCLLFDVTDNSVEASSEIAKPPSQRESVDIAGEDKSSSPKLSCEVQNEGEHVLHFLGGWSLI